MTEPASDAHATPLPIAARGARARPGRAFNEWLAAAAAWYLTGLLAALAFSLGFYFLRRGDYGVPQESGFLEAVAIFDGRWYRQIAAEGYSYNPEQRSNVAFFPVYPLLGRAVMRLTGLRPEVALLVVSNFSFLMALALLAAYVRARFRDAPAELTGCAILAAATFPTGCFFRLAYSESTFLLLTLLAMLGMARSWPLWRTALVVGLATAARPVGVALLAPLAIHFWRTTSAAVPPYLGNGLGAVPLAGGYRLARATARMMLYLPLGCWGLAAYMAFQWFAFSDPLAFANVQRHWGVMPELSLPAKLRSLATLAPIFSVYDISTPAYWAANDMRGLPWLSLQFANPVFLVMAIALVAFGAYRRWLSLEEMALSVLLLFIPYVTRAYEMGCASMGRFTIVAFPMYLVVGRLLVQLPVSVRCLLLALPSFLMAVYLAVFAAGYLVF